MDYATYSREADGRGSMKKVLVVTDIHLWYKDISTLKNSKELAERKVKDIITAVKENEIDHIILGGDVVHEGYKTDLIQFHSHYNLLQTLSNASRGENYLVCGNHAFLNASTNLELYINQPCSNTAYNPGGDIISPDKPLFKMTDFIEVEGAIISMHSFNKVDKSYMTPDSVVQNKQHIGIYHDETFVTYSNDRKEFIIKESALQTTFGNVDYAVINHIHMPKKSHYNGSTIFIQPGSIGATSVTDVANFGEYTSLPVFTIEDGEVTLSYIDIPTYRAEYQINLDELKKEKVKPLVLKIDKDHTGEGIYSYTSIEDYTQKLNVPIEVLKTVEFALSGQLTLDNLVKLYKEYKNIQDDSEFIEEEFVI